MFTTKKTDHKQDVIEAIDAYFEADAEKFEANVNVVGISGEKQLGNAVEAFATLKAKFEQLVAMSNEITNLVNKKFEEMSKDLACCMADCELEIRSYIEDNKYMLFPEKKSIDYAYGTVGYRVSKGLEIDVNGELKPTLALLKELPKKQREKLIRIKESVDKTALKKLDAEKLQELNAGMATRENFYIDPRTVVV